jgi:hypothetical protein
LRIERKGATGASSGKQGLLLMSRAATVSVCTSTLVGRGPTETRPRRSPVAFCCLLPSAYCPLPTALCLLPIQPGTSAGDESRPHLAPMPPTSIASLAVLPSRTPIFDFSRSSVLLSRSFWPSTCLP